jgi:hypothetical protein
LLHHAGQVDFAAQPVIELHGGQQGEVWPESFESANGL